MKHSALTWCVHGKVSSWNVCSEAGTYYFHPKWVQEDGWAKQGRRSGNGDTGYSTLARFEAAPTTLRRDSLLAIREPNCSARFGKRAAICRSRDAATSRSSRFSPSPRWRVRSAWLQRIETPNQLRSKANAATHSKKKTKKVFGGRVEQTKMK